MIIQAGGVGHGSPIGKLCLNHGECFAWAQRTFQTQCSVSRARYSYSIYPPVSGTPTLRSLPVILRGTRPVVNAIASDQYQIRPECGGPKTSTGLLAPDFWSRCDEAAASVCDNPGNQENHRNACLAGQHHALAQAAPTKQDTLRRGSTAYHLRLPLGRDEWIGFDGSTILGDAFIEPAQGITSLIKGYLNRGSSP